VSATSRARTSPGLLGIPVWLAYGTLAGLALAGYMLVPALQHGPFFNAISIAGVVAILVGVRVHRPSHPMAWYLLAIGQALFTAADIVTYNYPAIFGVELPFPSIGDPLYLAVYPCVALGLGRMIVRRSPGRDRGAFIDGLVIAIAAAAVSWGLVLSPIASAADSTFEQKLVGLAYPTLDLVLLTIVLRLALGAGQRTPSLYLMIGGLLALLASDSGYSWVSVQGIVIDQAGILDVGWGLFYILWAVSALHPSMATLTVREAGRTETPGWLRIGALAGAVLVGELVHVLQDEADGRLEEPLLYFATALGFLLVIMRMIGLIRRLQAGTDRQRTMREASSGLVAAIDREEVFKTAGAAAVSLCEPGSTVLLLSLDEHGDHQVAFDARRESTRSGEAVDLSGLLAIPADHVSDASVFAATPASVLSSLRLPRTASVVGRVPLEVRGVLRGHLVTATSARPSWDVVQSLEALAAQVAIALESLEMSASLADRRSDLRLESLVNNSSDVILILDELTGIRFASSASARVLGYASDSLVGKPLSDLIRPVDASRVLAFLDRVAGSEHLTGPIEFELRHADDRWLHLEALASNLIQDENVNGVVLNVRDISERKAIEDQLARQALYDSLTSLPNRALFLDRIKHALAQRDREATVVSVLFVNLDDFKSVNDSLGHAAADLLLVRVAERLQACLRASDTAAKFSGDEFCVLVEGVGREPIERAERILAAVRKPFVVDGTEIRISATIGIASTGPEDASAPELLRNADAAMHAAKAAGKGKWRAFEPAMHEALLRRLELRSELERALERQEFVLHYQPIVDIKSGLLRGVEALVRWVHPERGLVSPGEFIPYAEESGLIVPLGSWVLAEACRAAVTLDRAGGAQSYMSVNVSASQLQAPAFVDEVKATLAESELAPGRLILELTESAMMRDADLMVERLQSLREVGVRIAIDDFGTGYSSLQYLRHLPVDIVKIDQSFVRGMVGDPARKAIVATIIELANIMGLTHLAEGVEVADQHLALRDLECDLGQGYLWARPMPLDQLMAYMATEESSATAA